MNDEQEKEINIMYAVYKVNELIGYVSKYVNDNSSHPWNCWFRHSIWSENKCATREEAENWLKSNVPQLDLPGL